MGVEPEVRPQTGSRQTERSPGPEISQPKGGGAIRGIGEKFAANPVTGTGSVTIPLPTSPSRAGFGPQLSLSYDSGSGNGPFGYGWSLSLPAITRKTDQGLPQYRDAEESDCFVLSGAEDLVPVLQADGTRYRDDVSAPGFVIHRYRPRVEGLFARIERWTATDTGETHWRSITRNNVTTLYGKDDNSRISGLAGAAPTNPAGVFSWLICESCDDKGNAVVYQYVSEDAANVDIGQANERNRMRSANRYLKRVLYGNVISHLIQPDLGQMSWLFEAVFDYDEAHYEPVPFDPNQPADAQHRFVRASASAGQPWTVRPDPFSTYRSGFEVRSYRRCRRVLMFHHIDALPTGEIGYQGLTRSLAFHYADMDYGQPERIDDELAHQGSTRFASFIQSVTQSGYVRDDTQPVIVQNGVSYAIYLKQSLPPLEFTYSKALIQDQVHELDPVSLENLPSSLDAAHYWVDLDGEGISGFLTEQAGNWLYKANLGDGRFGPVEALTLQPSLADLSGGHQQLVDLAGEGQLDLAAFASSTPGFYERTLDGGWEPYRAFARVPNVVWDDPNLRFVDLDGDGRIDVLIAGNEVFTSYLSLAEEGFGPGREIPQAVDEEHGPRLVFADGEQSIFLADMSGDGLTDLVRIRDGEVSYWPNLGYGRFGSKVAMDNAPRMDRPEQFEQLRVRLADIDGSGTNDILYIGDDGVRVYFNQSGNRWSDARPLVQLPHLDNVTDVRVADLLGNGTACLVWSSPLPGDVSRPIRYIDLMGGVKPHLLINSINNLGSETRVQYAPSTRFYLADKRDGRPWITRLPFPVHVVERVETYDWVSGNRFVSRYAYHHGYFDGVEREFRGFGLIEEWDTEEFSALTADGNLPTGTNVDAASHVPPIHTRTWFHTGIYLNRAHISDQYADEYYREPGLADPASRLLDDTVLPDGLTADEEREACRALKGAMLRREVYALDGTAKEPHPYTVTEQNLTIRMLQPEGTNPHGVFLSLPRETLTYNYERKPADPRASHTLTLASDEYGNILASAALSYGRRTPDPALTPADQAKQAMILATYSEYRFTNAVDLADAHRTPLAAASGTFELTGLQLAVGVERFTLDEIVNAAAGATRIPYEQTPTAGMTELRLIEQTHTLYRSGDLSGPLPPGTVEELALPFESYTLAFTPGLVGAVYGGRVTDPMLADEGRYVHSEGDANWWVPSGRVFYSPGTSDTAAQELAYARAHFFLPHRTRDPFHTDAVSTERFFTYDGYDLLMQETRDILGNRVTAGERDQDPNLPPVLLSNDYRVLQPAILMDPSRNRSAIAFDALGLVVGTAAMGKPEDSPVPGDRLTPTFRADLTQAEIAQFFADPKGSAAALLDEASTRLVYDLMAYRRNPAVHAPSMVAKLERETHASDPVSPGGLRIQIGFSYSDGFSREIQMKMQTEPGPTPERAANGKIVVDANGQPVMTTGDTDPRWIGSGWTVFDNKGNPVLQYEPFFTDTHRFESDTRIGVSPVLFYDPVGRMVATLHSNRSWEKILFDPWAEEHWDVNDTVLTAPAHDDVIGPFVGRLRDTDYLPTWYDGRAGGAQGATEQDAAAKTAVHAGTPSLSYADSLGLAFVTVAHNRFEQNGTPVDEYYTTRVILDIEGNRREVHDANDRIVMRCDYDVLGTPIHQASMEAGERWMLNDAARKPIYAWDSRGHRLRTVYDALRRPTDLYMSEGGAPELLVGHTDYGESQPDPETKNLRGKVVQLLDQAGVVTTDDYDFKGNLLRSSRRLMHEYKATIDWSANPSLGLDTFTSSTTYDALNRPVTATTPDQSVYRPTFNEANRLEKVDVNLRGAQTATALVSNIDYNARGQRVLIEYGNGAKTEYAYDPATFRPVNLRTTRSFAPATLQDLSYTYDPGGNMTHIRDGAQQEIYFNNSVVTPDNDYIYDAVYRLIEATGREHIGQTSQPQTTWDDQFRVHLPAPTDGRAMRRYTERYEHDPVGNFLEMIHEAPNGNFTRSYAYDEVSLIEADKVSNRLSSTTVGSYPAEIYLHDAHGNMTSMPHLTLMQWDFRDQLRATSRQVVNDGTGKTTYYVYDGGSRCVRKVTERQNGTCEKERIYLGGVEVYREYDGNGTALSLERETLHVMDDKQRIALVETKTFDITSPRTPYPSLIRYQFSNHLGSAALELNNAGRTISYEEYYPYGSTSYQAGRSGVEVSPKRYRYTGKERDQETGLNYHTTRYYALWLGRWVSPDPAGLTGGLCLYKYASSNPILNVDPDGTDDKSAISPRIDEEYVPSVGAADRQPKKIPKGHGEVIGRLDLDDIFQKNTVLRGRVESVAKELDIDPGLFAATLVAEKGSEIWSRTSGKVTSEDLGFDDWFGRVKENKVDAKEKISNEPEREKRIIKAHPKLNLKFEDVKATGAWWDTSKEKTGGLLKPRGELDARKAVAVAGVYYKLQEEVLRQVINNLGSVQNLDDLLPEERLTLVRLAFNGGVRTAGDVFLDLANGGDIPRSGSTERDPRTTKSAIRTAVLHVARGIHLDQAVFGRPSSEYRPTVKLILRRMGATISFDNP